MTGSRVEIDTRQLEAGMARLADGITSAAQDAATDQASRVADALRSATPVLSGSLAGTVGVTEEPGGAGVTYGGDLPYANYIAHRSGNVEAATADAEQQWLAAAERAAEKEVRKL